VTDDSQVDRVSCGLMDVRIGRDRGRGLGRAGRRTRR
jgi:hypothetical protein